MSLTDREVVPPPSSETVRLLRQWRAAGEPIQLTINGKATLCVTDQKSYEALESLVDRLDLIECVRTGLKAIDEGQGISLDDFEAEVRRADGVSL